MSPDESSGPTTPDDALAIVHSQYAQPKLPDGTPVPLRVHEFDIGYLVQADFPPPPADASGQPQPAQPGGSNVIVDKATGETTTVPNYPAETAIALYREQRRRQA